MSNSATNQPRQPKGVPVGGQWRSANRPEGTVSLRPEANIGELYEQAREGTLPKGFDRWDLVPEHCRPRT